MSHLCLICKNGVGELPFDSDSSEGVIGIGLILKKLSIFNGIIIRFSKRGGVITIIEKVFISTSSYMPHTKSNKDIQVDEIVKRFIVKLFS